MNTININGNNIQKPIPIVVILIFGPAFAAAGIAIIMSVNLLVLKNSIQVPEWLIYVFGILFLTAGIGLLLARIFKKLAGFFGIIAMLSFVLIFNWVAFGPGERNFTSETNIGGYTTSEKVSETEGRIVFSLFAGAMDLVILSGIAI